MTQELTVGQVAQRLGLTVRTLHHYDQIGLVTPSERSSSGYRLYTEADLERLQHVIVYRRLEMPLETIRELLDASDAGDAAAHLRRQREAVTHRLDELSDLVAAIDRALEKTMSSQPITEAEMKELFGEGFEDYQDEAQERWGQTPEWKQSQQRTANYTKADWEAIKNEAGGIEARLAALFTAGAQPNSLEAMDAVEAHRTHISRWFYDCSLEMHRCLGELYVSDPRFTAKYDGHFEAPGLAEWIRQVIGHNADRQQG